MKEYLAQAASWLGAWILAQWTQVPDIVFTLMWIMALDYITGLSVAFIRREACSTKGFRGLLIKLLELILLLTVHLLEEATGVEYGLEKWVAVGLILNEALSIIENMQRGGVPIPLKLVQGLRQFKTVRFEQGDETLPVILSHTKTETNRKTETTVVLEPGKTDSVE